MKHAHPAVKKALKANRTTVSQSFSLPIELFETLFSDAKQQRRSVSQVTSIILEQHYAAQDTQAAA